MVDKLKIRITMNVYVRYIWWNVTLLYIWWNVVFSGATSKSKATRWSLCLQASKRKTSIWSIVIYCCCEVGNPETKGGKSYKKNYGLLCIISDCVYLRKGIYTKGIHLLQVPQRHSWSVDIVQLWRMIAETISITLELQGYNGFGMF